MFEFIEDIKLRIRQDRERRNLEKAKDAEFKVLEDKKQYDTTKETLDRDIELEIRKAKIRKQQAISPQKAGNNAQQPEKKSAFAAFQDYCTDFANNQSKTKPMVGSLNFGGLNGIKKSNKRSRGRTATGNF